jgi:hypothetical protein
MGEGIGLNTGIVSAESGGHEYHLLLLLMSLLIRDVGELEAVSIRKPDKIFPHSVLLSCKQVQLFECILPILVLVEVQEVKCWDLLSN